MILTWLNVCPLVLTRYQWYAPANSRVWEPLYAKERTVCFARGQSKSGRVELCGPSPPACKVHQKLQCMLAAFGDTSVLILFSLPVDAWLRLFLTEHVHDKICRTSFAHKESRKAADSIEHKLYFTSPDLSRSVLKLIWSRLGGLGFRVLELGPWVQRLLLQPSAWEWESSEKQSGSRIP